MKRYVLFTLLCIGVLSIGAIVYAGLVQPDSTSMLSDQEMAQITGTTDCTCYLIEHVDCRYCGNLSCSTIGGCPSETERFHDPYRYTTTSQGERNDKKHSPGTVACYTPTNILSNGWEPNQECKTDTPTGCDPDEWEGWWYDCWFSAGKTCDLCKWGTPSGSSSMREDSDCVPI